MRTHTAAPLVSGPACGRWALVILIAVLAWFVQSRFVLAADTTPLCRFGIGAGQNIVNYPIGNLRIGWYADWTATPAPVRPGGMAYLPMVRFKPVGDSGYSATPTGQALIDISRNNPGATWVVGNEPDRKIFQDDLKPEVYARAYHDLYYQIKAADPTARVAAGSIVQPTPLRLEYLDKVLSSYRAQFNAFFPADVWNIHGFILREMSCNYDPNSCWGAEVPPGSDKPYGMLYQIGDNDNFEVFKQFIVDFRQWMQARGYQQTPLIITEFGILMPPEYGFDAARVSAYMNKTFDYLQTAVGPAGYPYDGYRYVQQFAWYSIDDYTFNGYLFDSKTRQITAIGQNFAAYTSKVPSQVNLQPVASTVKAAPGASGVSLITSVVNNGNVRLAGPVKVRVYDRNPAAGGKPIAPDAEFSGIEGCASAMLQITSGPLPKGLANRTKVWVAVDPDNLISEANELDNVLEVTVFVPSTWRWLPNISLQN